MKMYLLIWAKLSAFILTLTFCADGYRVGYLFCYEKRMQNFQFSRIPSHLGIHRDAPKLFQLFNSKGYSLILGIHFSRYCDVQALGTQLMNIMKSLWHDKILNLLSS